MHQEERSVEIPQVQIHEKTRHLSSVEIPKVTKRVPRRKRRALSGVKVLSVQLGPPEGQW